jgi:hypothetical protein
MQGEEKKPLKTFYWAGGREEKKTPPKKSFMGSRQGRGKKTP